MNNLHIFLATPMYGGMCTGEFARSLLKLDNVLAEEKINLTTSFIYNESLINRARNDLTKIFLNTDCTHLLFIDADIVFNPYDVIKLIKEDKDIIGGMYPLKTIDWKKIKKSAQENNPYFYRMGFNYVFNTKKDKPVPLDKNLVVEVDAIGTGYMLVKRNVFNIIEAYEYVNNSSMFSNSDDKITKNFFNIGIDPETKNLLSEDYYFCKSWKNHGGKIFLATYAKARHVGSYIYG